MSPEELVWRQAPINGSSSPAFTALLALVEVLKSSFIAAVDLDWSIVGDQGKCLSAGFPHVKYLDQTALGLVHKKHLQVELKHLVACVYTIVYITHFIQKSTMII